MRTFELMLNCPCGGQVVDALHWPAQVVEGYLVDYDVVPHRKHEGRVLFHRGELDAWLDGYWEARN
jgi:hypothetical protein